MRNRLYTIAMMTVCTFHMCRIATASAPPFPDTDTFDNGGHPNPGLWQESTIADYGWRFLSSTVASGTLDPGGSGTILAGGPEGPYGRYDGPDGTAVSWRTLEAPIFGAFNFNAKFDPYNASETGQQRFWLNNHPGNYNFSQKPQLHFNTLANEKVRLQLARQNGSDWVDDQLALSTNQWYNFDVRYSIGYGAAGGGEWTLAIKDMADNAVFDDGLVYHWDSGIGAPVIGWASFEKRDVAGGGAPAPAWNIDEINTLAPQRATDFGIQRVRENDFLIMGAAIGNSPSFDINTYHNAGFNQVFVNNNQALAQQMANAGVDYHLHWNPGLNYEPYNTSTKIMFNSLASKGGLENNTGIANFQAVMLNDEPQTVGDLNNLAESNAWLHHFRPEVMTYVNLASSEDSAFMQQVIDIVKPDALSFDIFPALSANGNGADVFDRGAMFRSTMRVRAATLAADIPFFVFTQATDFGGTIPILDRQPSESEMRLNSWIPLAAGAKGINYFSYDDDVGGGTHSYFFDSGGNPTQFYANAAAANAEIAQVGKTLRNLTSTDVRFVPGGVSSTPDDLTNWNAAAGPGTGILNVEVDGPPTQDKNGLISFFVDDDGNDYFMLVNMYTAPTLDAAQTSLGFTVTFDSSVDSIWRLSRTTGMEVEMVLLNHVLNWTLPGGTGDLFRYDPVLLGDVNFDGVVNIFDINLVSSNWNGSGPTGDANKDGVVNIFDINVISANWSPPPGNAAAVPEPSSVVLAGLGLMGMCAVAWRRRRDAGR